MPKIIQSLDLLAATGVVLPVSVKVEKTEASILITVLRHYNVRTTKANCIKKQQKLDVKNNPATKEIYSSCNRNHVITKQLCLNVLIP